MDLSSVAAADAGRGPIESRGAALVPTARPAVFWHKLPISREASKKPLGPPRQDRGPRPPTPPIPTIVTSALASRPLTGIALCTGRDGSVCAQAVSALSRSSNSLALDDRRSFCNQCVIGLARDPAEARSHRFLTRPLLTAASAVGAGPGDHVRHADPVRRDARHAGSLRSSTRDKRLASATAASVWRTHSNLPR